jgi:hypothetical protein
MRPRSPWSVSSQNRAALQEECLFDQPRWVPFVPDWSSIWQSRSPYEPHLVEFTIRSRSSEAPCTHRQPHSPSSCHSPSLERSSISVVRTCRRLEDTEWCTRKSARWPGWILNKLHQAFDTLSEAVNESLTRNLPYFFQPATRWQFTGITFGSLIKDSQITNITADFRHSERKASPYWTLARR